MGESPFAVARRMCQKFALPDWLEPALAETIADRIETGSDDKKEKEIARIEKEFDGMEYIKGPRIANGAFGEVFKGCVQCCVYACIHV